jgi:hypothetical protein
MSTSGQHVTTANAALWAYETKFRFCHVWVETILSREIAKGGRYQAEPIAKFRGKRTLIAFFDHLCSDA